MAANPKAGDLIQGTGGQRKLRWARDGPGKAERKALAGLVGVMVEVRLAR